MTVRSGDEAEGAKVLSKGHGSYQQVCLEFTRQVRANGEAD